MAIEDWIDQDTLGYEDEAGFETTCRGCRRTIRMMPTTAGWRPFDKHGEEPHHCSEATDKDFPPA